ncbi:hypothetical protein LRP30_15945 [Bradyrhizobium sp. C-145]|nr:ATP-binding protein [Bradyrhizobium sp. C-145]UQR66651.1 hypothetical protein LRP30_15945 [Bradyrhizobium sp. C-145]
MSALKEAFAAAEAVGIEQHRIPFGDLLFNVARFGKGGRRLLLLHGWPEFWLVWRRSTARTESGPTTLGWIISDGLRAGEIIGRIQVLIKKAPPRRVEINAAVLEVIALTHGEVMKNGVSVPTQLADGLPLIRVDRVQLQQVVLNLIFNAVEAMSAFREEPRELLICTERDALNGVLVSLRDSGPGLDPASLARLRSILHDQAQWHGHGIINLPFDRGSARGTHKGGRE